MSLERLVEEIRQRAQAELEEEARRADAEAAKLRGEHGRRAEAARAEAARLTKVDAARERAQRIASAKLQARKGEFEARERRMVAALGDAREALQAFAASPEYPEALKRMYANAVDRLGKGTRVRGRAEDAARLKALARTGFDPEPLPVIGGLVAESADGSRRLNLSLDELLRLREDEVRALLVG